MIAVVLFSKCDATSTATLADHTDVKVPSTNAGQITTAIQTKENTVLRRLRAKIDEDSDDEDDGDEERGVGISKIDDIVDEFVDGTADTIPSIMKIFKNWDKQTVEGILNTPALRKLPEKQFLGLLTMWGEYKLLGAKPFVEKLKRVQDKRGKLLS
ncbi:unnamed protein product [Phytophthora lilii]|uniref:RxLR effector protein n=1 Tax=Phytophthora lilii TaxID=2077276 RepID=A0A9W6TDL7_9STRA|nr:unnamed protein product [Phytophthora lilii]